MRKTRIAVLAVVLLCALATAGVVSAEMFLNNYGVPWNARWGGGGRSSSANYAINGTVGQGAIGWTESNNYGVGAGYWYGVEGEHKVYLPLVLRESAP
jgi:hypothetical protein